MNGSLYTWSNLNQYFASYLKHNGNPELTPEDTSFLMPCIFLVQYCVMTIGVKLGDKIGPRFVTLIGVCFMYLSYIIMMIFKNYYLILISMGIFGLGDGLANLSVIKNCWKYFPQNLGLVNGIIIGGLGLSSFILTPIADYLIINPNKIEPENGIYPKNVSDKLFNYLIFLSILFFLFGILAILLTFKYENEEEPSKIEVLNEKPSNNNLKLLFEGFFSEKNYFLLLFCFCGPCKYIFLIFFYFFSFMFFDNKYC